MKFRLTASLRPEKLTVAQAVADAIAEYIQAIPAADVVELVRCKECWHHRGGSCVRWADGTLMSPDDYCSRGIRADNREARD